jgi:hypothetical protein
MMVEKQRLLPFFLLSIIVVLLAVGIALIQMVSLFSFRSPLHNNPPAPGESLGFPLTHRVILVLMDGLREDTSLHAGTMPFLNILRENGAWATMHSQPPSYSAPGYSVLITGAWPELSDGPVMNPLTRDFPAISQDNIFSAVHRLGTGLTAVSGYTWFKLIPENVVDESFHTEGENNSADRDVVDAAIPWLASLQYQLILIHIDQIDYAGHHEGGPRDRRWAEAATRADTLLGEISSYLDLGKDTIIVLSDHGHIDQGGHGGIEPETLTEFVVMAGSGINAGRFAEIQMADIAPTIAILLGANIPASNQGRGLLNMLNLQKDEGTEIQQALNAQQARLVKAYESALSIDLPNEILDMSVADGVATYQEEIQQIRTKYLRGARLRRGILAISIAAVIAFTLVKNRSSILWLSVGCALIAISSFHIIYSLIFRQTYSFSSIQSPEKFIRFIFLYSLFSYLFGWLFLLVKTKRANKGTRVLAKITLLTGCLTAGFLMIPLLFIFYQNGIYFTKLLPEFPSLFVGLLFLAEIIFTNLIAQLISGLVLLLNKPAGV